MADLDDMDLVVRRVNETYAGVDAEIFAEVLQRAREKRSMTASPTERPVRRADSPRKA
jgi:hypothetical protein